MSQVAARLGTLATALSVLLTVSVIAPGSAVAGGRESAGRSFVMSISDDGRYAAFTSEYEPGTPYGGYTGYLRDIPCAVTRPVERQARVPISRFAGPVIATPDGRFIAYSIIEPIGPPRIVVYDRFTGRATPAISDSLATPTSFNSDGRYLAYGGGRVLDRWTGRTDQLGTAVDGTPPNGGIWSARLSADGRYAAFLSDATNLVPADRNGRVVDAFFYDRARRTTRLVSTGLGGTQPLSHVTEVALSGNGHLVAFTTRTPMIIGDWNGDYDVYVRDLVNGEPWELMLGSVGNGLANGSSGSPALSADGNWLAYTTTADNHIPGDTNGLPDVFLRDLSGVGFGLQRVSLGSGGRQLDAASTLGAISGDGRYIAFSTAASNAVTGDTNGVADGFVRDTRSGTTRRVTLLPD